MLAHALRSNLVREELSRLFQASFGLRLDFLSEGTGQHIVVLLAFSNLWTKRLLLLLLSLCIIYVC